MIASKKILFYIESTTYYLFQRGILMRKKISIFLSIALTILYLIKFSTLTHLTHAIVIVLLSMVYIVTSKLAGEGGRKFRIWINSMFLIMVLLPVFIAPSYFDLFSKSIRVIGSIAIVVSVFNKEKNHNKT